MVGCFLLSLTRKEGLIIAFIYLRSIYKTKKNELFSKCSVCLWNISVASKIYQLNYNKMLISVHLSKRRNVIFRGQGNSKLDMCLPCMKPRQVQCLAPYMVVYLPYRQDWSLSLTRQGSNQTPNSDIILKMKSTRQGSNQTPKLWHYFKEKKHIHKTGVKQKSLKLQCFLSYLKIEE